jgi:hypothetical protein
MGWMIVHAQVTEFAGFWPLEGDFLDDSHNGRIAGQAR